MEIFQKLGDEIGVLWRNENYNEEAFPSIAAAALKRAELPSKLSAWDAAEWTLKQAELPPQRDPHANFGEPPITLYVGPRFYIDLYFWLEGTTAVHQHSFCGAFQVLMGSSIHSWYDFSVKESVNDYTEIGEMDLKVCELLEVGAVQEIVAGRRYIHSLFHLDQPSATVVVRNDGSPRHQPQYSYHKPSLALDPFFDHQTTTKKLQMISSLFRSNHPDTDRMVTDLLASSDFQTTFRVLSAAHGALRTNEIEQIFNLSKSTDRFRGFLDTAVQRHGEKAETLVEVFRHFDMVGEILRLRRLVSNPEHRFFFALLMNIDGRERIFSLIKQRFPDADPLEKVLDWTFDLANTRIAGAKNINALGLESFDNADMFVLENLLHSRSVEQMRSDPAANGLDLESKAAKIREAVIFRPLLITEKGEFATQSSLP